MKKVRKSIHEVILSALILFIIMSFASIDANAYTLFTGKGIGNRPLTFYVYESTPSMYITALKAGISTWNNAGYGTMFTYGGTTGYVPPVNTPNGQNGVRTIALGVLADYAVTTDYYNTATGIIQEADISVNSSHQYFVSLAGTGADLVSVFTHELGHALGLGEEKYNTEATMYEGMPYNETKKRTLDSDDLAGLDVLY